MTPVTDLVKRLRELADHAERRELELNTEAIRQAASTLEAQAARIGELESQGWQPIHTAPRDGTKIQLAVIDGAGNILSDTGEWVEGETHEEWDEVDDGVMVKLWEDQEEGQWSTNYCIGALEEPTHWMPARASLAQKQEG